MDNTSFYNRILNGTETQDDIVKFNNMCQDYSDIYKDVYGYRPRDEQSMCVNGYSGNPDINKFRELLKQGINPLLDLDKAYDSYIEDENDWMKDCIERDFFETNPSKEQIINRNPEYAQYFV